MNTTVTPTEPEDIPNMTADNLNTKENIASDSNLKTNLNKAISYIKSPNNDILLYIREGQDFTDKYIQCAECGKYIALGNVTKMLPENLICHAHEDMFGGGRYDADYPWIVSYDEIMTYDETGYYPDSVYERVANHYNLTLDQYYDVTGFDGREKTAYLNDNGELVYFSESDVPAEPTGIVHTGDVDVNTIVNVPAEPDTVSTEDASQNSTIE